MPKIMVKCEACDKEIYRYECEIFNHVFCSRKCSKDYTSKRMSEMNKELNPTRMTDDIKNKIRVARVLSSNRKSYPKINNRHIHRIVAEQKLGRKLRPGEIVHHKDGDKQNYLPENLEILDSQKEHAKVHQKDGRFKNVNRKKVNSIEIHTT